VANYKIENVEGIGPVTGEKLRAAGVKDTESLLASVRTPKQREELAQKTGLGHEQMLTFANMADLYRISGVGAEYAELLEAAGVDTVPELAKRNAANLTEALAAFNEEKKLARRVPPAGSVSKWIEQAKSLPRMIEH